MIAKGKSVAGGDRLAKHVLRTDTNEKVRVAEMRGVAAEDVRGAFLEMEAVATANPNCKKPFYHASINTRPDERLTDAQRLRAIDKLEDELGLAGQPRVVIIHEKLGREHCHIVWSRLNPETMRVISDSHNYRKHEKVARELEREFGHERVQGAHVERDGKPRPPRTPSHKEHQQAERTGVRPKAAKEFLSGIWRDTGNGRQFQERLEEKGWILTRGDRRDFVAVDPKGGVHSIARRIEGVKAVDVRQRFADINPSALARVAEAREAQAQRGAPHGKPRAAQRQPTKKPSNAKATALSPSIAPAAAVIGAGVAGAALKVIGKTLDGVASAFEGLLGGGPPPKSAGDHERSQRDDNDFPLAAGPAPSEIERAAAVAREEDEKAKLAAKYGLEFGHEVPFERVPDMKIEHERGGRERKRGE